MIVFGNHLRKARKLSKLSARQVTERVGISMTFIYEIERGKKRPSLETVIKLSQLYKDPSLVNDYMRANNIADVQIDVSLSEEKQRVLEEFSNLALNDGHKIGKKLVDIVSKDEKALEEWTRILHAFIAKHTQPYDDDTE